MPRYLISQLSEVCRGVLVGTWVTRVHSDNFSRPRPVFFGYVSTHLKPQLSYLIALPAEPHFFYSFTVDSGGWGYYSHRLLWVECPYAVDGTYTPSYI